MKKNEISARTARNSVTQRRSALAHSVLACLPPHTRKITKSTYWAKQPGSRILRTNNITLSGNAASTPSTTFSNQTYQVRVNSTLAGQLRIGDGAQTAVANTDAYVAANAPAEYFSVNPGQQAAFISTSTSADIVRWSTWRSATLQIELHLVLPPSANQLWTRTRKGLRKTDRYTLWLAAKPQRYQDTAPRLRF